MATVPSNNITLKTIYQTMYANTSTPTQNFSMSRLYGTHLTAPVSGPIRHSDFSGKVGNSYDISTFVGFNQTNTTFTGTFTSMGLSDAKVFASSMWVTIAYSGLYKSTNGTDWTQVIAGDFRKIFMDNGVLYITNGSGGGVGYVTTDGVNFTSHGTAGLSFYTASVSKIGSTIVRTGTGGSGQGAGVEYSTNGGSSWTTISSIGGLTTLGRGYLVAYWPTQNKLYLLGTSTDRKYSSTDGINWTNLGTGTGVASSLTANQGFAGALEVKTATGDAAFCFADRNSSTNSTLITTDGINYTTSTEITSQRGWIGRINNWYVAAPSSFSNLINWAATGQTWPNFTIASTLGDSYYVGFSNRLYAFKMYVPNSTSSKMQWGYFDFSTVAPS